MAAPINIYFIWYGSWEKTVPPILEDMISHLDTSPWYQINPNI